MFMGVRSGRCSMAGRPSLAPRKPIEQGVMTGTGPPVVVSDRRPSREFSKCLIQLVGAGDSKIPTPCSRGNCADASAVLCVILIGPKIAVPPTFRRPFPAERNGQVSC